MLELTRKEEKIDRLGRTYSHTVFIFLCDVCGSSYERRGSMKRFLSRKTHAYSNGCKSISHKQGGVVEKILSKTCIDRYGAENVSKSNYFASLNFENKNCKTGYAKFRRRDIWFRPSYEESFIKRLGANSTVADVKCNIATKYEFEGKVHIYFVDFAIEFSDGRKALFEAKSEYMKNRSKNLAKFVSVRSQLDELHYDDFVVITEKDLYRSKKAEQ